MNDVVSAPLGATGPEDDVLTFRWRQQRADPDAISGARTELGAWLIGCGPRDAVIHHDVILAANEALANAVEHAYPHTSGLVDCHAHYDSGRDTLTVVVRDYGHWRPPAAVGNRPVISRGRGLVLMRALADHVDVHATDGGTTVSLTWHPFWGRRTTS